jgi:uncharacterized UBP type Zn finger protein
VLEFAGSMGIPAPYIKKVCDHFPSHSTEMLVNYLLENPFDNGSIPEKVEQEEENLEVEVEKTWNMTQDNQKSSQYELVSTVVHLGKSVGSGHYVAYVKEELNGGAKQWVYYNDDAVYHSGNPRLDKSYMLFLKKRPANKIIEE